MHPSMLTFTEEFWSKLRQIVREEIKQSQPDQSSDVWLSCQEAAEYLGCPSLRAFYGLRRRHPEIDQCSVSTGKLRRWKRSDLDQLLKMPFLARGSK